MSKKWRRSGGRGLQLPAGPVLVPLAGELVRLEGDAAWAGTRFVRFQVAFAEAGPWDDLSEQPITTVPEIFADYAGQAGNWARAAVTIGDGIPLTQWSIPVQVLA